MRSNKWTMKIIGEGKRMQGGISQKETQGPYTSTRIQFIYIK